MAGVRVHDRRCSAMSRSQANECLGVFSAPEPAVADGSSAGSSYAPECRAERLAVRPLARTVEPSNPVHEFLADALMAGPLMGGTQRRLSIDAGVVAVALIGLFLLPGLASTSPAPVDPDVNPTASITVEDPDVSITPTPVIAAPTAQATLAPLPSTPTSTTTPPTTAPPTTQVARVLAKGTLP